MIDKNMKNKEKQKQQISSKNKIIILVIIILFLIVGVFLYKYGLPIINEKRLERAKSCAQDSDCEILTFSCCPPPDPCGVKNSEIVNKNYKDQIEQYLKSKCDLPCPLYSPPACSECLELEDITPVCVNNQCTVKREINCDNYCQAVKKDKSELCPWISDESLITEENTKKCKCIISQKSTGFIEGSLGYPSEFIPEDMVICAENIATKKLYCTEDHIKNKKYTHGVGYKIEVPAGDYFVYAYLAETPTYSKDYKAYYSEFVTCGFSVECPSHQPIKVIVEVNQTESNIDPQDWYIY